MNNPIRCIPVFIASPDGVLKERAATDTAIKALSEALRRLHHITLLPVQWENFAPITRADHFQPAILENIEPNSIFVGILHKRYGTPIAEMNNLSGTETEFDHAIANRNAIKILTYFKNIRTTTHSKEEKRQIQLLTTLKAKLQKEKILHRLFHTTSEFKDHIFADLLTTVLEILMGAEEKRRHDLMEFYKLGCHYKRADERPSVRIIYPPMHQVASQAERMITLNWQHHLCPLVVYEDMKAFQKIESNLQTVGVRDYASVTTNYPTSQEDRNANRIWVCIPRNTRAQDMLAFFGNKVRFRFLYKNNVSNSASRYLLWHNEHGSVQVNSPLNKYLELSSRPNSEQPWRSEFANIVAKDYGIIARFQSSGEQAAERDSFYHFFFGGIRGLGTWGVGWYVDRYPATLAAMSRQLCGEPLQLLVEVTYRNHRIVKVEDVSGMTQSYFDSQNDKDTIRSIIEAEEGRSPAVPSLMPL